MKPVVTNGSNLPEALLGRRQLKSADQFCFDCHSQLDCFKRCCSDINILLTPLDVLTLSRRLKVSTTEFLDQYTQMPITKELHLPVVMLKMDTGPEKNCRLLGEQGCTVYEQRPWACRMYPVGMALPPARAGVEPSPYHFLMEDEYCHGHTRGKQWRVESWSKDQGIAQREKVEHGFHELVSHPWFIGGRRLDPKRMHLFYMACYDLDTFRRFVFGSTFLTRFALKREEVKALREDDLALLRFGFRWLRLALFGEPTLKARVASAGDP